MTLCVLIYCILIFCFTRKKKHGSSLCLCFLVLTLLHLYVALWMFTGAVLHVSLCSLDEVSFRQETQVSGVRLFCILSLDCFVCVKRQRFQKVEFYSYIFWVFHPQIQINKLFKWTHRFETFMSLAVLCTDCWEKRRSIFILAAKMDFCRGCMCTLRCRWAVEGLKCWMYSKIHISGTCKVVPPHSSLVFTVYVHMKTLWELLPFINF